MISTKINQFFSEKFGARLKTEYNARIINLVNDSYFIDKINLLVNKRVVEVSISGILEISLRHSTL
jgi:hypothetical protein